MANLGYTTSGDTTWLILTSNRGFAERGELFGDPGVATALLDRLLHHAVTTPPSCRSRAPAAACAATPT